MTTGMRALIPTLLCMVACVYSMPDSSSDRNDELLNGGRPCLSECNREMGPCEWCGTKGMCCAVINYPQDSGCDGTFGGRLTPICAHPSIKAAINKGTITPSPTTPRPTISKPATPTVPEGPTTTAYEYVSDIVCSGALKKDAENFEECLTVCNIDKKCKYAAYRKDECLVYGHGSMIEYFNEKVHHRTPGRFRWSDSLDILPTGRFPSTCYNGPLKVDRNTGLMSEDWEELDGKLISKQAVLAHAQLEFKNGMFKKLDAYYSTPINTTRHKKSLESCVGIFKEKKLQEPKLVVSFDYFPTLVDAKPKATFRYDCYLNHEGWGKTGVKKEWNSLFKGLTVSNAGSILRPAQECKDHMTSDSSCEKWKNLGECTPSCSTADCIYTKKMCPRSCGLCVEIPNA